MYPFKLRCGFLDHSAIFSVQVRVQCNHEEMNLVRKCSCHSYCSGVSQSVHCFPDYPLLNMWHHRESDIIEFLTDDVPTLVEGKASSPQHTWNFLSKLYFCVQAASYSPLGHQIGNAYTLVVPNFYPLITMMKRNSIIPFPLLSSSVVVFFGPLKLCFL